MGRALLATMQAEGIDCSHVICDATQRTGFQFKGRVNDGSDPPVEYHRKGSAASHMGPADVDEAWLRSRGICMRRACSPRSRTTLPDRDRAWS